MPEGPEVYLLSVHLQRLGVPCFAYGKHIFVEINPSENKLRDISFGLYGRVYYSKKDNVLEKVLGGPISGDDKIVTVTNISKDLGLGPDYMSLTLEQCQALVRKWATMKRTLASIMLDQEEIAGLGVAWISEIAYRAGRLDLSLKAKDLDLRALPNTMMAVQEYIKKELQDIFSTWDSETFVNGWFQNIYKVRQMLVYKKGRPVLIHSRQFWM